MDPSDILMMNRRFFEEMKDLAERQERLISEDQIDEFNLLLNRREQIRRDITANTREYDLETRDHPYKRQDQKVMEVSNEIRKIISSIQDTDRRIEAILTLKRDSFRDEIKTIRKGRSAIRSYAGARHIKTRFLDRKG